jgi:1-acyl-sn-glycerol-3-phosphate acyltransferase
MANPDLAKECSMRLNVCTRREAGAALTALERKRSLESNCHLPSRSAQALTPSSLWLARARLTSLWLSQVARIAADFALRIHVMFRVARAGQAESEYAYHLVAAIVMVPFIVLAPFNGALCNSLPKRLVLAGSALYCTVVAALLGVLDGPWIAGWALLALGMAIYSPARYALLPAASTDTQWPLTRVNGWIEMGAVVAMVAGMVAGAQQEIPDLQWLDLPVVPLAVALNGIGFVTALPVWFPSDIRRPENANQAISGFFRDAGRIWQDRRARAALLGMSTLRAIVAGGTGAFLARMLGDSVDFGHKIQSAVEVAGWILLGAAAGSVLAGVERHPCRALGLVAVGAVGLVVSFVFAAAGATDAWLCVFLGVMCGLINVPLAAAYQLFVPADARGNAMAIRNLSDCFFMTTIAVFLGALAAARLLSTSGQLWVVAAVASVALLIAWMVLYREVMELFLEIVLWPVYRVKAHGEGIHHFPTHGPVLVVANHAAWLDPIWLGKVLPRTLRPMMTSTFYDLPVIRWLMVHVVGAIRVTASSFRREAPELDEAVRGLDAGQVIVLFPEGSLRRTEERPLRRFGQGVYHILRQRPGTPVVVCWIEGNWKSFFSYFKGPPTKNKPLDFWRHVDIAVGEPIVLDEATLADHRTTRAFLEQRCREMRGVLGLEVPRPDSAPEPEEAAS